MSTEQMRGWDKAIVLAGLALAASCLALAGESSANGVCSPALVRFAFSAIFSVHLLLIARFSVFPPAHLHRHSD